jgi:hypothetical protein
MGARGGLQRVTAGAAAVALAVAARGATAQAQGQTEPVLRVTRVEGPRTRSALTRRLTQAVSFWSCQSTLMGGPVRVRVRVETDGHVRVEATHAGEETAPYARCVARRLGRVVLTPAADVTRAWLEVEFPAVMGPVTPAP